MEFLVRLKLDSKYKKVMAEVVGDKLIDSIDGRLDKDTIVLLEGRGTEKVI